MRVAVIGAGTMGAGIAQLCAVAGHDVALCDTSPAALAAAGDAMGDSLDRFVRKEVLTAAQATEARGRVATTGSVGEAAEGSGLVVEAVVELLGVKQEVFRQVVAAAPADALLGTNTSQLSVTGIGAAIGDDAERLVGMHFFNPPVLMRLVELVQGLRTSPEALARAQELAEGLGKETVVCRRDSPGFLTSRISAIVRLECLRMLEEGVGSASDIDKALRLGLNFPMGPLELGDFNGLDTYLAALEGLAAAHGDRFRPPVALRNLVAAGRLGRKTGAGIYRYTDDGRQVDDGDVR